MRFATRLVVGTVAVVLATVLVLVVWAQRSLRSDLERELRLNLEREASLIRGGLPPDSLAWEVAVDRLAREGRVRITLIDSSGRVRADSDVPHDGLARVENHAGRPEVAAALRGVVGSYRRHSTTVGRDLMYVAVSGGPGVVRVALPLDQVDLTVRQAQRPVIVAALGAVLLGALLALMATRSIARPINDMISATQTIAAGGTPQFPHSGVPDLDRLTQTLKDMHQQLALRFEEVRRKQAETTAIVDAMTEGVISCDSRGQIVTANPGARRLLGYGDGAPIPQLPLLFRAKAAREVVQAVLAGETVSDREIELDQRVCLLSARPLPAGGAVLVLHDLTRLRRLEAVRRDFVANVSHELKTPLTAISGYAETLLGDVPPPDPETARRFLETILGNARRMQRLVDDQLDLSRIESGRWTPALGQVDVAAAFRDLWTGFECQGVHLPRFELEVDPAAETVPVDPEALRQILRNLFENSLRHTPAGGVVTGMAVPEEDGIRISVRDTGSGIPSEHLPRIFERFYRVDVARARNHGGTGLGLAIVRHLVEAHGGRVWAESELGRGTTIHCWFPSA